MKKIIFVVSVACIILHGCDTNNTEYWKNINAKGKILVSDDSGITLEKTILDSIYCSNIGSLYYNDEVFIFLDEVFNFAYLFNHNGKFVNRFLGKGQGPNDIIASRSFLPHRDGCVIYGDLQLYYDLDKNWNIIQKGIFNWGESHSPNEIYNNPTPDMPEIYEVIDYNNTPRIFKDSLLLLPISTSHWKYNGYIMSDYYSNSRIFAIMSIKTGNIHSIEGRRSPEYLKSKYLPNFDFFHFDTKNDDIILNYDIDSSIYVLDNNFIPKVKFGFAGKDMNTNYKATSMIEQAEDRFFDDRKQYGYYNYLEYIEHTGLTFRTYTRGNADEDGLQVYDKEYNLIVDTDVPKGFRVIGYNNGEYFAECENGKASFPMYILKFKL